MKKIFGELELTWKKLIISAIVIGVVVGLINSITALKDTSLTDWAIYFDFWVLIGILIIMNSHSNKEAALKSFVFFLISQPLIYLVEVPFSHLGWQLFTYYRYWFIWTILTIPMGFIGYYLKKDKWWGIIILLPMLILTGSDAGIYLKNTIFSFPRHLLSYLFCITCLVLYALYIFNNKKNKIACLVISLIIAIGFSIYAILDKQIYETELMCTNETINYDDTYNVYLKDKKYGEVSIRETKEIEAYCIHAKFTKSGKTKLIVESKDGDKKTFDLKIRRDNYTIVEEK